jgi:hypothetical protein
METCTLRYKQAYTLAQYVMANNLKLQEENQDKSASRFCRPVAARMTYVLQLLCNRMEENQP